MRRRGVQVLLGLTLAIAVGTLVQDFRFDQSIARERVASQATDRGFGAALESLAQLRMAQAAYLAAGQGSATWITRAAELSTGIETMIAGARAPRRRAPKRAAGMMRPTRH